MDFATFKSLYDQYRVIPVYEKITADLLTPVLAYLKIREKGKYCFLLESVEGIGRLARYSFLGKDPVRIISNYGRNITVKENGRIHHSEANLFDFLREEANRFSSPALDDLPDFTGGIVGYLGYENVTLIEDVVQLKREGEIGTPDAIFALYDTIIAFDHYKHLLILIKNIFVDQWDNPEEAYQSAKGSIKLLKKQLLKPLRYRAGFSFHTNGRDMIQDRRFIELVNRAKKNIQAGDIFQIVLSQRFQAGYEGDLLNVYRALRMINPSPYMYFIEFDADFTVIGTSPEDLLKVKNHHATILPIAGTRRRGRSESEDKALAEELLADPKERAEHVMLIDLARNDLGRVCKLNSVRVSEMMRIQYYSHVMHIVSRVEGELAEGKDCIDALKAAFPAGTLTGAPKIRAMQLIDGYEKVTRNVYGGAVGYIDFSGNLDMCIAIRTMFVKGDTIYWQAGAGIVADSQAGLELEEINNKSAVLVSALKYAGELDAYSGD